MQSVSQYMFRYIIKWLIFCISFSVHVSSLIRCIMASSSIQFFGESMGDSIIIFPSMWYRNFHNHAIQLSSSKITFVFVSLKILFWSPAVSCCQRIFMTICCPIVVCIVIVTTPASVYRWERANPILDKGAWRSAIGKVHEIPRRWSRAKMILFVSFSKNSLAGRDACNW